MPLYLCMQKTAPDTLGLYIPSHQKRHSILKYSYYFVHLFCTIYSSHFSADNIKPGLPKVITWGKGGEPTTFKMHVLDILMEAL